MGPYAGLDLVRKIFDLTPAQKDQDHLPVALLSYPHEIPDRSTFLFDETQPSPVPALFHIAQRLEAAGATVAAIPCNTAHAPAIFDVLDARLREGGHRLQLVHMIREAVAYAREALPSIQRVGFLSTLAVYRLGMYETPIREAGLTPVLPDETIQCDVINPTIFDATYGIKAHANPVTDQARRQLLDAIEHLREKGAEAVFLGCTELPLAIPESRIGDVLIIDPTAVLARVLIRETYPGRLTPMSQAA